MPPKKDSDQAGNEAVRSLCYLLTTSKTFEPDLGELAQYVGVKDKKNVPRKINSLVSPYGFEFKDQKIIEKSSDGVNGNHVAAPKSTSGKDQNGEPHTPKTPTVGKKRGTNTPKQKSETKAKTPVTKKRKMEDIEDMEQNAVEDKDEVQEMIIAAMGGENEEELIIKGDMEEA